MSTLQIEKPALDWELEFIKTGQIDTVPEEDRERVLHELNELCELLRVVQDMI